MINTLYMKHFFSALLFMAPLILQGQEIKVNVFYKNEPLPYTYINVNGTPIAIANAAGVANIPVDKLNSGDTITSKMIGLLPVSLIYNQQIQQNQECELIHTEEDIFALGEVVIFGYGNNRSRRILREVLNTNSRLHQNYLVNAKFSSIITLSNGTAYPIEGTFVLEKKTKGTSMTLPLINTRSDTSNLNHDLMTSIHGVYGMACAIIIRLNLERARQHSNTYMSYIGHKEGCHFFRYINTSNQNKSAIHILFAANADLQTLANAKYTVLHLMNDNFANYTINTSFQKLTPRISRTTITVPKDIEANIVRPDGTVIDLKIDNISIQFKE